MYNITFKYFVKQNLILKNLILTAKFNNNSIILSILTSSSKITSHYGFILFLNISLLHFSHI